MVWNGSMANADNKQDSKQCYMPLNTPLHGKQRKFALMVHSLDVIDGLGIFKLNVITG